jgi:hypothetical protein
MKKCPKTKNCAKNLYQKKKKNLKAWQIWPIETGILRRNIFHLKNFQGQNFPRIHHKIKYNKNHCCCARPIFHISRDLTTVLTLEKK